MKPVCPLMLWRLKVVELSNGPDASIWHHYCDFWCMNRYYGWYVKGEQEWNLADF